MDLQHGLSINGLVYLRNNRYKVIDWPNSRLDYFIGQFNLSRCWGCQAEDRASLGTLAGLQLAAHGTLVGM